MRLVNIFSLLLLLPFTVNAEKLYTFCYDPYPPYTLGESGVTEKGLKVDLLKAVFSELGLKTETILLPWKQCQNQAKLGNVDGILPLFKNAERETYMAFTDEAFMQSSVFWYKRSLFPDGVNWDQFSDLKNLKLGMLIGGFIDKDMEAMFDSHKGIYRGKSVKNLFQVLEKERVDLIAIDEGVGRFILQKNGWQDDFSAVEKPIGLQASFFGLSKKSQLASRLDEINKIIANLRQRGVIEKIQNGEY